MNTYTLINIPRNKIRNTDALISKIFPGTSLCGYYVKNKPVASRAFLITKDGMDVEHIISVAKLKKA
jgi:hypothetical protein